MEMDQSSRPDQRDLSVTAGSAPPVIQPSRDLSAEELEKRQVELFSKVGEIVKQVSDFLILWPAISIIAIGAAVIATDLLVEVSDPRMSSTEYVSTLVTGAVVCVIGGAFEMNRGRQLKSVAETGLEAAGRVPDAELKEMMRQVRGSAKGIEAPDGGDVSR
jgi:hypothetical protein